jgi:cobalamin synthase
MLDEFIQWLGNTPVSLVIQRVFWIIPTVQTVHILAISVVVASMAMFDLRLLRVAGRRNSIESYSRRFMPWLWGSLVVLVVTGSILIVGEPKRALGNVVFLLKMCMLATAIAVTLAFQAVLKRDLAGGGGDLKPAHFKIATMTGLLSLILWVGIVVAGRLIAYTS